MQQVLMLHTACITPGSAARTLSGRPRRKMHDFGDLGRALEMVALLPGVALGG